MHELLGSIGVRQEDLLSWSRGSCEWTESTVRGEIRFLLPSGPGTDLVPDHIRKFIQDGGLMLHRSFELLQALLEPPDQASDASSQSDEFDHAHGLRGEEIGRASCRER